MTKLEEAKNFYKGRIEGWMINDLEKSIIAKTNFLTALGCLVYTEVIGIFLPPLSRETGSKKEKRFYRSLFRLKSSDYLRDLDKFLKRETRKGIYGHMRHNMAHKYFPAVSISKRSGTIVLFIPTVVARDGIDRFGKKSAPPIFVTNDGKIVIAFRNYIKELKSLVKDSYKKTFIDRLPDYQKAAIEGIDIVLRGKV